MLVCSPSFSFRFVFFFVWTLRFSFRLIYVFGTHTHEKKRGIFVVVIWNLPLKQRCCCCFLFISKILFCYYVVGISLYFYNSFLFYFAYILLHSARHYDSNLSLKYKSSVCWFLFFNLLSFVLLLITHIVSVFLSKTHTRARRKILQIGHGSTNFISGAQFFNIFVCCVCDFKAARDCITFLFFICVLSFFVYVFVFICFQLEFWPFCKLRAWFFVFLLLPLFALISFCLKRVCVCVNLW